MTTPRGPQRGGPIRIVLPAILLTIGLLGHLLAADAEGGRALHYRHHILGFVILLVASAVVVGVLGHFFWRGRRNVSILIVAAAQALFGLVIYAIFRGG